MKRKLLIETPVCPRERLVIISYTTGLSFAEERIGPLAAIVTTVFYLLALYLFALSNTLENLFASIYSESLIKTTCQHLLLLVGFDTLIYRKYYDTPPILVGHQRLQTETGVHTNLPGFGPPEGKDLHPACLILYCLYSWSCYNGEQMGSGYGRKRWRVLAYAWDLCQIRCLCEINLSRGCPWWLYICSQLWFTSSFCLLLQVEVLDLADFMYPSSGLLAWQEPGRPI
jgi:hypothetical protein